MTEQFEHRKQKLQEILNRNSGKSKSTDQSDQIDPYLMQQLKEAEQKYLNKKKLQQATITLSELETLDTNYESTKTQVSFLFSILCLIASLFSIIGILIITTVVYFAEEEVQLLFEIPEVDSRVFRLELREQTVIIPFLVQVAVCVRHITLITMDSVVEIWQYISPNSRALTNLLIIVIFQSLITLTIFVLYLKGHTHTHHIVCNLATNLQLAAIYVNAKSKVADIYEAKKKRLFRSEPYHTSNSSVDEFINQYKYIE